MRFLGMLLLLLPLLLSVTIRPDNRTPALGPPGALAVGDLLAATPAVSTGKGSAIVGAWRLRGGFRLFGNYSALTALPDGRLLALGDRNDTLVFAPPGRPRRPVLAQMPFPGTWGRDGHSFDGEAVTALAGTQRLLVACEGADTLALFDPDLRRFRRITVPALREWGYNQGPEAMRQLADGRLVLVAEMRARWYDRTRYPGLIFAGVPRPGERPGRFELVMPEGFRPTELAQMPDGRVLVLGRKFALTGFHSVIVAADAGTIRDGAVVPTHEVARISDSRLRENYEGMAVLPEPDGSSAVWLISDSNTMAWLQRTILLKLRLRS